MENYSWYNVLHYWCFRKDPIGSGLSIPFLIGVEREFGRGEDYHIEDLISELNSINSELSITIRYCSNIDMDVCCLDELTNQEKKYYKSIDSIFLAVDDYDELKTFKEFQSVVKSEYLDYVERGNYSINNGKWSGFTDDDLLLINNIL